MFVVFTVQSLLNFVKTLNITSFVPSQY